MMVRAHTKFQSCLSERQLRDGVFFHHGSARPTMPETGQECRVVVFGSKTSTLEPQSRRFITATPSVAHMRIALSSFLREGHARRAKAQSGNGIRQWSTQNFCFLTRDFPVIVSERCAQVHGEDGQVKHRGHMQTGGGQAFARRTDGHNLSNVVCVAHRKNLRTACTPLHKKWTRCLRTEEPYDESWFVFFARTTFMSLFS